MQQDRNRLRRLLKMSWSCCIHTIRSLTLEYPFEIRKQSAIEEA